MLWILAFVLFVSGFGLTTSGLVWTMTMAREMMFLSSVGLCVYTAIVFVSGGLGIMSLCSASLITSKLLLGI